MRKDITEENCKGKEGEKMNVSELARQYGCCWLTANKRVHPEKYPKKENTRVYTSILDPYKVIIKEKIEKENIPATGIYYLLKKQYEYKGSYSTVRNYISKIKKQIVEELTIRFETIMGFQSQVDWKEKMTLKNRNGVSFTFNIFLLVTGYSRYKYLELTSDRSQITLFNCLTNAFNYLGGTTQEIIFDNMKTVVDHAKSSYRNVVINNKFNQFSKDARFTIFTCRAYRPKTKGKVETLAKIMNRLKAFDGEFDTWEDLNKIVEELLYELNYEEKSQATDEVPIKLFEKEKEHLVPVNIDLLKTYIEQETTYKVSNESMIKYKGKKYSVPTTYVGKSLSVKEDDEFISIYYTTEFICSYNKNNSKRYNYKKQDYLDILKQSAYREKTIEEISQLTLNNLSSLNGINIEEE